MKSQTTAKAVLLLLAVGVVGTTASRILSGPPSDDSFVIIRDNSPSMAKDCVGVVNIAHALLEEKGHHFGRHSRLIILGIGTAATSGDPIKAGDLAIPTAIAGGVNRGKAVKAQQALFDEVLHACETLVPVSGSSIHRAIEIAAQYLEAAGCSDKSHCIAWIQSDGLESFSPTAAAVLGGDSTKLSLLTPIPNANAQIRFCDYNAVTSMTAGRPEGRLLQERWRSLFASKDNVRFAPFCPGDKNGTQRTPVSVSEKQK